MDIKNNEELTVLIEKATAGHEKSLETIILSVQDLVFNLSLRMLGSFPRNTPEAHHSSLLLPKREFIYHMGFQHCVQPSEKL